MAVVLMVVSGLAIQHASTLKLDARYVSIPWILHWYGLSPDPVVSYRAGAHWISHAGDHLYLDRRALEGTFPDLRGAAWTGEFLVVASGGDLYLFTPQGELVERLEPGIGLPEPVVSLAENDDGEVLIQGPTRSWQADEQWLDWAPYAARPVHPITATAPPPELQQAVERHDLAHEITWERLLLDLHSGRLFGHYGIYVVDVASIGLLILALSGIWLWMQRRPSRRPPSR